MKVNPSHCFDCGDCLSICPVDAILKQEGAISIDQSRCVECGVCWRTNVCPTSVFEPEDLPWPRVLRALFSDPAIEHRRTGVAGRGLEEIKTNDVCRVYAGDLVGVTAEIGRPGIGASFHDVQCITQTLAESGARLAADNPLMELFVDPGHGLIRPDILKERILSVIVEYLVPKADLERILRILIEASFRLSVPVLLSVAGVYAADGTTPYQDVLEEMALDCLPTGKINLGFMR